jgi:NAD(P)-dependent dehydrogenase (short-subunit alcohol dehydrogenase family)
MPSILVTGASRGLGLALTESFSQAGWTVFAPCRDPNRAPLLTEAAHATPELVRLFPLDVTDHGAVDELSAELRDESIDILFNNAGIYGPKKMFFGQLDYPAWREVMEINTLAPMKMSEAFVDQIERSDMKMIVNLSSDLGSIRNNTFGRHYLYRTSKAALNMVSRTLAVDLADRGIIVVAVNPGWVKTDLGGPQAPLTASQSVHTIMKLLPKLTMQDSGKFFLYDGTEIPW